MENVGEINKQQKETLGDPFELFCKYYSSDSYKKGFEEYYKSKTLSDDVTEKEKEKNFLDTEEAKVLFVNFCRDNYDFKFIPSRYSPRCQEKILTYLNHVEYKISREKEGFRDGDEVIALDQLRYDYHNDAANSLTEEGFTPSRKMGRALLKIMAINKGLDTWENAKRKDMDAIRSKLGI